MARDTLSKLERKLNVLRTEFGLIGGRVSVSTLDDKKRNIEAVISLKDFQIYFKVNPKIQQTWSEEENIKRYAEATGIQDTFFEVCKTIFLHELWHWKKDTFTGEIGCPTDIHHSSLILDRIYNVIKDKPALKNVSDEKLKMHIAEEMAQAFQDILVNSNLAYTGESNGLCVVYYDFCKGEPLSPLTEAFYKLQMNVWGTEHDRKLLEGMYSKDEEQKKRIDGVVEKALAGMGIKENHLKDAIAIFRNPKQWQNLASQFAGYFAELIELKKEEKCEGAPNAAKDGMENKEKNKNDIFQIPKIADSLDTKINEDEEHEIIVACYGKDASPPSFISEPKRLKHLYEHLAKEIPIEAKSDEEGFAMPLFPLTEEPFQLHEHNPQEIDFRRPLFDPESVFPNNINFPVVSDSYMVEVPYTKRKQRLPNVMFLFDCSGSMVEGSGKNLGSGWSDKSKYHYALLGAFGAIRWLKKQSIAPYLRYNVTVFSNCTRSSGWKGYGELEQAMDLFWEPEFGGTYITMDVVSQQLKKDKAVIIFITDGAIENWENIKTSFKNLARRHYLSYIQIKEHTQTGKDLGAWGFPVYHINKGSDLNGLILSVTSQSYRQFKP